MKPQVIYPSSCRLNKLSIETIARVRLVVSAMLIANDVIPRGSTVTVVEANNFLRDMKHGTNRIVPPRLATAKRDAMMLEASRFLRKVAPGVLSNVR